MRRSIGGLAALVAIAAVWAVPAASQTMDDHIYTYVAFDELEWAPGLDERPLEFDGQMWIGGDFDRFWLKARGEHATRGGEGGLEFEALYGRTVSAFWDAQVGLRLDRAYGGDEAGASRGLIGFGVQGLAPYWFEVEAFGYVSHRGDVSARLEAAYDLLFTQRLVLEPEVAFDIAAQDVERFGVARGIDRVELAARLRYEIVREFAPYVGVAWVRDRVPGPVNPPSETALVAGLRWWY